MTQRNQGDARHAGGGNGPARPNSGSPRPRSSAPGRGSKFDPSALHRTLERALTPVRHGGSPLDFEDANDVDEAAHAALLEVARRLRQEKFGVEPVLVEMVAAMLRGVIGDAANDSPALKRASRAAAELLYDDPACRARSEALWARLREDAA